ncbi:MAG TPA: pentapeptide repeat-containing protein [Sedimentisphaerales bacterium]|nr:pentapeptide repeat-containing protein [Sedimentisphaerales bacterium]
MSDSEKPKSSWWEIITNCCVSIDRKCKPTERRFDQCAILKILGYAGRFTVLVAVIFYIKGCPERKMQSANLQMQVKHLESQLENQLKSQHYQAWQVINSAQGKPGNGGRVDALHDLHRDGISLAGVDISKANLPKLNLEKADLSEAILSNAILSDANFSGANFRQAVLSGADLHHADLSGTDLSHANLSSYLGLSGGTELSYADFSGAVLKSAKLRGVHLINANLSGADLSHADLYNAVLSQADFSGADFNQANIFGAIFYQADLTGAKFYEVDFSGIDLSEANLRNSNLRFIKKWRDIKRIKHANIYNVKNPPDGFKEWAKKNGAVEIEDEKEWIEYIQKKKQERTKQKQ